MKNINFEPNMELIRINDFYLFYEMMTQSLKTDNVKEGIQTSFTLLREFLQSGHISLYKKMKKDNILLKRMIHLWLNYFFQLLALLIDHKLYSKQMKFFHLI